MGSGGSVYGAFWGWCPGGALSRTSSSVGASPFFKGLLKELLRGYYGAHLMVSIRAPEAALMRVL